MIKCLEHPSYEERLSKLSLEKGRLRRDTNKCADTWAQGVKKLETDPSQWCPERGREVMSTNWNVKSHLNIRKHIFTVRVMKHWNGLPREMSKSHLQSHANLTSPGLEQPSPAVSAWCHAGVGPGHLGCPFQPQPFTDSDFWRIFPSLQFGYKEWVLLSYLKNVQES